MNRKAVYFILIILILFSLTVRVVSIIRPDGLAEIEDYHWPNSNPLPVNVFDDDGRVTMNVILDYYDLDQYPPFRVGGPMIYLYKVLFSLADSIGLIHIYKDPWMYSLYPEEANKLFIFGRLLTSFIFVPGIIIMVYLLGARFFNIRVGLLASLLMTLNHFFLAWSWVLKNDLVMLFFLLCAFYFTFKIIENNYLKNYILSGLFWGISLSIKLSGLPFFLVFLFVWGFTFFSVKEPQKEFILKKIFYFLGSAILVFFIADPSYLLKIKYFVSSFLFGTVLEHQGAGSIVNKIKAIPSGFVYQIRHLTLIAGPLYQYCIALFGGYILICIYQIIKKKDKTYVCHLAIILFVCLHQLFLIFCLTPSYASHTYFILASLPCVMLIIANILEGSYAYLIKHKSLKILSVLVVVFSLYGIGKNFALTYNYFKFWTNKDGRQMSRDWILKKLDNTTSVGIPFSGGSFFDLYYKLDYFKYNLKRVGEQAENINNLLPEYFLWAKTGFAYKNVPEIVLEKYKLIETFNPAQEIIENNKHAFLHRVQPYEIYQLKDKYLEEKKAETAQSLAYKLGNYVRSDSEPYFRLLSWHAVMAWVNNTVLFEKQNGTLVFANNHCFDLLTSLDSVWLKKHNARNFYYEPLWNIDPLFYFLTNLKYILVKEDPLVKKYFVNNPFFNVEKLQQWFINKEQFLLLKNNDYLSPVMVFHNTHIISDKVLEKSSSENLWNFEKDFYLEENTTFKYHIDNDLLAKHKGEFLLFSFKIKNSNSELVVNIQNNRWPMTRTFKTTQKYQHCLLPLKVASGVNFFNLELLSQKKIKLEDCHLSWLKMPKNDQAVNILECGPSKVRVKLNSQVKLPAYVVISYPNTGNWKAYVNNRKAKILSAFNGTLPAVYVTEKDSEILFSY